MSTAMPQAWPLYSCGGYIERPGSGSCPSSWIACLFFASSASVTARTMCRSSAWWCAVASIVQWSWVQATIAVSPVLRSCRPPRPHARVARAQRVRVEAHAVADAAGARAAVAEVHGHGAVGVARQHPERRHDRAAAERELGELGHVAARGLLRLHAAESGGGLRAHERHVVPGDLAERLRQLLQPAEVGEAPVEDGRIRAERDLEPVRAAACGRRRGGPGAGLDAQRPGFEGRPRDDAVVERPVPALLEVGLPERALPVGADDRVALLLALA